MVSYSSMFVLKQKHPAFASNDKSKILPLLTPQTSDVHQSAA
jgi:hypothetical protein